MLVNDAYEAAEGKLTLTLERADGVRLVDRGIPFAVPGLGQQTYAIELQVPQATGQCTLKAAALINGQREPTSSRRNVAVQGSAW